MALTKAGEGSKRGIFYGWWIVLFTSTLSFLGSGVYFYGFAVFFNPISSEFNWTRAETSGAFSLARLEGGPMAPIVGWLVDKFGPRKLMLFGITIAGLGFLLMTVVDSLFLFYIIYGLVISFGFNFGFGSALTTSIANWFVRKRARAFSMFTLGAGLGGGIVVPTIAWLISLYGWRTTAVLIAISIWVVGYPVALVVRHRPEQYGLLPDGDDPATFAALNRKREALEHAEVEAEIAGAAQKRSNASVEAHYHGKEAIRTSAFWLLAAGYTFRATGMTAVVVHQVPFLVDIGISEQAAATALGMMTLISLIGRLSFGYIGDLVPARFAISVAFLLQAIGLFILAGATSMDQVYWFLLFYSIGYGGVFPLQSAQIAEYFGRKSFGTVIGLLQLVMMLGTVTGPVFAGYMFDTTGNYFVAFMSFVVAYVLGAVFIFIAKPPKPTEKQLSRAL